MKRARALALLLLALPVGGIGAAHPLHTATLTLTHEPAAHTLRGTLRVFADDFSAAAGHDSVAIARYLAPRISLHDARGSARAIRFGAPAREADVIVVPVRVEGIASPRGMRASVVVMQERFTDQVNVMRIKRSGGDASVLFLAGDGPKTIP